MFLFRPTVRCWWNSEQRIKLVDIAGSKHPRIEIDVVGIRNTTATANTLIPSAAVTGNSNKKRYRYRVTIVTSVTDGSYSVEFLLECFLHSLKVNNLLLLLGVTTELVLDNRSIHFHFLK